MFEYKNTPKGEECTQNQGTTSCLIPNAKQYCELIPPAVVTEFIDGYDLKTILNATEDSKLYEWQQNIDADKLWQTLSVGLQDYNTKHIAGQACAHRDINPKNIMVYNSSGVQKYKIINFGEATCHVMNTRNPRPNEIRGDPLYWYPNMKWLKPTVGDIYSSLLTILQVKFIQEKKSNFTNYTNKLHTCKRNDSYEWWETYFKKNCSVALEKLKDIFF